MEYMRWLEHPSSLLIYFFHKIPHVIWAPVSDSQTLQSLQKPSEDSMLYIFPEVTEEFDSPLSTEPPLRRFSVLQVMYWKKSLFV